MELPGLCAIDWRAWLVYYRSSYTHLARDDDEHLLRDIIVRGVVEGTFRPVDSAVAGRAVLSILNWMVR
jgi:hypothetical protein